MTEVPQRDWKKIVEDSNGSLIFAPEKFIPKIKEWEEKRIQLNKLANEAAKHELATRMVLENTVSEIRAYLAENGYPDIWLADVGFEAQAIKEGQFIINVSNFPNPSK